MRKNNRDEIAMVFIQVKFWLKRSLGQLKGGMGKRHVQSQEQDVVGNLPRWRPAVRHVYKEEIALSWREEEEPGDGSDLTTEFQEAVSFL
jgi:hypothetical protein